MTDFKKALEEGFIAAKRAEFARKEVEQTLERFKQELLAASDNKLFVELREIEKEDPKSIIERYNEILNPAAAYVQLMQRNKSYFALVAKNPKSQEKEIATWRQAKDGYPCCLIWGKQEHQCEDRIALENTLAELLKDPYIG